MKKLTLSAAMALAFAASGYAIAEESPLDIGRFALAGYGDVSYSDIDGMNTNVVSRFNPIFLFRLSDKIHIETELELSINELG